ncbi:DUF664 domain-containing protein [Aeromicrobium sp. CTD01-1L150]|uniref:mycothiol transferase n=1 Tax=Aeromicrobium sp. CTD01-1L150 TaxID=3341830 RepID=UPI0035C18196
MIEPTTTIAVLEDSFDRIRELVESVCTGLDLERATFRIDPGANTPAWLVWHLSRVQDDHLAELAGRPQAWLRWRDRFDLPFGPEATGYGHSADDVAAVRAHGELLAAYHADVHDLTLEYVRSLETAELDRVVDDSWDPPVTASVRLVSVVGDCLQHLGQAEFILGVADRRR